MAYADLLKDPRWQRKRLAILERDGWKCQECNCAERTLHVHHRRYRGKPWEADDRDLVTLCEDCHASVTAKSARIRELLGQIPEHHLDRVIGYLEGAVCQIGASDTAFSLAKRPSLEWQCGVADALGLDLGDVLVTRAPDGSWSATLGRPLRHCAPEETATGVPR